ncbi:MAG: disulfide bond formation protein B [Alphaproteobacteria bacterium]|nr:disulfide bond formation protein B [Alphaproteobacteria bacterium]
MSQPSARLIFISIALAAALALLLGLLAEHFLGLVPCQLCLYQRYAYILICILALVFAITKRSQILGLYLSALAFLSNGAIAFYQVLIEKKVISASRYCTGDVAAESVEELRHKLTTTKLAACDEVSWSLFDISMAGYGAMYCFVCSMLIMFYSVHYLSKNH